VVAGKASGKRTLAEIMDQDLAAKKKMREQSQTPKKANVLTESRFFSGASNSKPNIQEDLVAGPSRTLNFVEDEKENVPMSDEDLDFATDLAEDPVTQEDGYISPAPCYSHQDTPDLSSPLRPGATRKGEVDDGLEEFGADTISSPETSKVAPHRRFRPIEKLEWPQSHILVRDTPVPDQRDKEDERKDGPDLGDLFDDDMTSEIDCFDENTPDTTPPITPADSSQMEVELGMSVDDFESVDMEAEDIAARTEVVANGWWDKWGHAGKDKEGKFQVRLLLHSFRCAVWVDVY
jgi:hypothetical protein